MGQMTRVRHQVVMFRRVDARDVGADRTPEFFHFRRILFACSGGRNDKDVGVCVKGREPVFGSRFFGSGHRMPADEASIHRERRLFDDALDTADIGQDSAGLHEMRILPDVFDDLRDRHTENENIRVGKSLFGSRIAAVDDVVFQRPFCYGGTARPAAAFVAAVFQRHSERGAEKPDPDDCRVFPLRVHVQRYRLIVSRSVAAALRAASAKSSPFEA